MATVQRFLRIDLGGDELAPPIQLANGTWVVEGWATRAGVFRYLNADGSDRFEYRSPEEVAKAATNLPLRAMTNNHPPRGVGRVTPANASTYQQGVVLEAKWVAEKLRIWVRCLLTHEDLIRAVKAGKKELSCGYECDVIERKGEYEGQPYTHEQVGIEHNHLAVVDRGRAGPDCALRLDAEGNVEAPSTQPITTPEGTPPVDKQAAPSSNVGRNTPLHPAPPGAEENPPMEEVEVWINGITFKVSKAVAAAIAEERNKQEQLRLQGEQKVTQLIQQTTTATQERATAEATAATAAAEADAAKANMELAKVETVAAKADAAAARAELTKVRADADAAKARADSAEAELKKEQKARSDAEDPTRLQQRVDSRIALVQQASPVLGTNYKFDGRDDHDVRLDALDKLLAGDANKDLKAALDTRRDNAVYVEALFTSQMDLFRRSGSRLDQGAPLRPITAGGSGGNRADGSVPKTSQDWQVHSRTAWQPQAATPSGR